MVKPYAFLYFSSKTTINTKFQEDTTIHKSINLGWSACPFPIRNLSGSSIIRSERSKPRALAGTTTNSSKSKVWTLNNWIYRINRENRQLKTMRKCKLLRTGRSLTIRPGDRFKVSHDLRRITCLFKMYIKVNKWSMCLNVRPMCQCSIQEITRPRPLWKKGAFQILITWCPIKWYNNSKIKITKCNTAATWGQQRSWRRALPKMWISWSGMKTKKTSSWINITIQNFQNS